MAKTSSEKTESLIFNKGEVAPNFQVGIPVFIELIQKKRRLRAQALVVGWSPKQVLITTLPMDNRMLIIPTGSELIVRYLLEGTVYGFITRLLHKQQGPFAMWLLEYPEVVEVKNLRRSPRIPLYLKVHTEDGEEWDMLDVSLFGAAMATEENQFLGDDVSLRFTLPDGSEIEDLSCKVVRVNYSDQESIIGVQFDEKDLEALAKIRGYIEGCLRRQELTKGGS
ncbi:MAG: flagellar brake protein [Candidatus Lernaella stagnicola]|nr:flagellar brake protein [Candidatus Lernaella stagnicola]